VKVLFGTREWADAFVKGFGEWKFKPSNLEEAFQMPDKVIAKLNGEWYVCCYCGHKLAKKVQGCVCTTQDASVVNTAQIEIKCKHRTSGKACDTVNVLEI